MKHADKHGRYCTFKSGRNRFWRILNIKNARISLQQIVRELEATQQAKLWSPMILSGSGFGVTNHSLIMASYLSRANAAID